MSTDHTLPKPHSGWWHFIAIGLIAAVLLSILGFFVRNQLVRDKQLKMEQLNSARGLWETKGAKDYQMLYTVQRGGGSGTDRYFVEVRGGKVREVILNGNQRLEPDKMPYHSMEGLFTDIEIFLNRDARPDAAATFCRGYFDSEDGHLLLFVRRVVGGTERVEIKVEELRVVREK